MRFRNLLVYSGKFAAAVVASRLPGILANPYKENKQNTPTFLPRLIESTDHKAAFAPSTTPTSSHKIITPHKLLSSMGLKPKQIEALKELLVIGHVLDNKRDFETKYTGGSGSSGKALATLALLNLIKDTQLHFAKRNHDSDKPLERWETESSNWMDHPEIRNIISCLGFVDEVPPRAIYKSERAEKDSTHMAGTMPLSAKPYYFSNSPIRTMASGSVIAVLGSTYKTMLKRCHEIVKLEQFLGGPGSIGAIILLGGARKASRIDGTDEELELIAKDFETTKDKLTETHLIQHALNLTYHPDPTITPIVVIDTAASGVARPTTKTTVEEFTKWAKCNPGINGVYFISNQPYVNYQQTVISPIIAEQLPELKFEVVGPEAPLTIANKSLIEAVASFLWAQGPYVIKDLGLPLTEEAIDLARKLYKAHPDVEKIISAGATCDTTPDFPSPTH